MTDNLREAALDYHRYPTPGKISVTPTKAMSTRKNCVTAHAIGTIACRATCRCA